LVPADSPQQFCATCRHNRVIPDLSQPGLLGHWRLIEIAKRQLLYTLLRLRHPVETRVEIQMGWFLISLRLLLRLR
jgi:hypothetical protein